MVDAVVFGQQDAPVFLGDGVGVGEGELGRRLDDGRRCGAAANAFEGAEE